MGLALVLGLFDLASFLLLAGALVFVPGRRTDREAWRFRATVVGALGLWAVVWGLAFIDQARGQHSFWIPYTSPSSFLDTVNGLVSFYPVTGLAALVLVGIGVVGLRQVDRPLGRLVGWLFVLPLAAACVIGIRSHFLLAGPWPRAPGRCRWLWPRWSSWPGGGRRSWSGWRWWRWGWC